MGKRKKRIPPKTIFIACEGKNTEPIYFERIKEEIEDDNCFAITVYPDRNNDKHKSDPMGLINEAQNRINDFDEVWAVYDKDGYTKHKEAIEKANEIINGKIVNIAFSSISFEHWVLLHFEKNSKTYIKSENIVNEKFISNDNYFPEYSKKSNFDIYPYIRKLMSNAIENASWLRYIKKDELNNDEKYNVNPFTDIDILIKKLFNISVNIRFYTIGELLNFDGIIIQTSIKGGNICYDISNNLERAIVLNEINFSIIEDGNSRKLNQTNKVIEPNSVYSISFSEDTALQFVVEFQNVKAISVVE